MEEFKAAGVTEKNLRLKVPYTTDKSGGGLGFSMPDAGSKILYVYLNDELVGQITLV